MLPLPVGEVASARGDHTTSLALLGQTLHAGLQLLVCQPRCPRGDVVAFVLLRRIASCHGCIKRHPEQRVFHAGIELSSRLLFPNEQGEAGQCASYEVGQEDQVVPLSSQDNEVQNHQSTS